MGEERRRRECCWFNSEFRLIGARKQSSRWLGQKQKTIIRVAFSMTFIFEVHCQQGEGRGSFKCTTRYFECGIRPKFITIICFRPVLAVSDLVERPWGEAKQPVYRVRA